MRSSAASVAIAGCASQCSRDPGRPVPEWAPADRPLDGRRVNEREWFPYPAGPNGASENVSPVGAARYGAGRARSNRPTYRARPQGRVRNLAIAPRRCRDRRASDDRPGGQGAGGESSRVPTTVQRIVRSTALTRAVDRRRAHVKPSEIAEAAPPRACRRRPTLASGTSFGAREPVPGSSRRRRPVPPLTWLRRGRRAVSIVGWRATT